MLTSHANTVGDTCFHMQCACMYYYLFVFRKAYSHILLDLCLVIQVSNLFQNQEDLLSEFSQFLPEATAYSSSLIMGGPPVSTKKQALGSGAGKSNRGTRKVSIAISK